MEFLCKIFLNQIEKAFWFLFSSFQRQGLRALPSAKPGITSEKNHIMQIMWYFCISAPIFLTPALIPIGFLSDSAPIGKLMLLIPAPASVFHGS